MFDLALILPLNIKPIAYLCLGYVREFEEKADLEPNKLLDRMPLNEVVSFEIWNKK